MASQLSAMEYVCATIAIITVFSHKIALVCAVVAAVAVFTKLIAAAFLAMSYYCYYYYCCVPRYSVGVHNATNTRQSKHANDCYYYRIQLVITLCAAATCVYNDFFARSS
jgi:hypothetical protein